jgi:hypothetical protein
MLLIFFQSICFILLLQFRVSYSKTSKGSVAVEIDESGNAALSSWTGFDRKRATALLGSMTMSDSSLLTVNYNGFTLHMDCKKKAVVMFSYLAVQGTATF